MDPWLEKKKRLLRKIILDMVVMKKGHVPLPACDTWLSI
jgi:hypothetical protein